MGLKIKLPLAQRLLDFDDTVLNKSYSREIEGVRRQWSGNEHRIIQGIGVVNCLYDNREIEKFWVIDYRIFDPENDGKTQLDHVEDRVKGAFYSKAICFKTVLMDTWYATKKLLGLMESLGKIYYGPLKTNRLVDDSLA